MKKFKRSITALVACALIVSQFGMDMIPVAASESLSTETSIPQEGEAGTEQTADVTTTEASESVSSTEQTDSEIAAATEQNTTEMSQITEAVTSVGATVTVDAEDTTPKKLSIRQQRAASLPKAVAGETSLDLHSTNPAITACAESLEDAYGDTCYPVEYLGLKIGQSAEEYANGASVNFGF